MYTDKNILINTNTMFYSLSMRASGATDNVPDCGSGDSRFASWLARFHPNKRQIIFFLIRYFILEFAFRLPSLKKKVRFIWGKAKMWFIACSSVRYIKIVILKNALVLCNEIFTSWGNLREKMLQVTKNILMNEHL